MDREFVVIEDGAVRYVRETTVKEMSEGRLLEELKARVNTGFETGFLPSGTVAYSATGSLKRYYVWRPPRRVTFTLAQALMDTLKRTKPEITLALPHQIYVVQLQGSSVVDMRAWFMPEAPHPDAKVCAAPFPNQDSTGKMCGGEITKISGASSAAIVDKLIGYFYASMWNADIVISDIRVPPEIATTPEFLQPCETRERSVAKVLYNWEKCTAELADDNDWASKVCAWAWVPVNTLGRMFGGL